MYPIILNVGTLFSVVHTPNPILPFVSSCDVAIAVDAPLGQGTKCVPTALAFSTGFLAFGALLLERRC